MNLSLARLSEKKQNPRRNCLYILTNKNTQYRSKGSGKNWFLLLLGLSLNVVFAKRCEKKVAFLPKVNFRVFFKGGALEGHHHEPPFFQDFPSLPPFQGNGRWITEVNWCWRRNQRAESKKVISPCHLPCHLLSKTMEKILKLQLKKYTSHKKHPKPRMNPWFLQQNINLNIHTWASASVLLASNTLLCSAIAFTKGSGTPPGSRVARWNLYPTYWSWVPPWLAVSSL